MVWKMSPTTSVGLKTMITNYVPVNLKISKDKEIAIFLGRCCSNYLLALSKIHILSQNSNFSEFNFYQLTYLEFV